MHRCEGDYLEEICGFLGRGLRTGHPLLDLTYVNLHKAPMTGTSIAESLIMQNLTRFLWLGISRLMGKKTPKRDNTISYQSAVPGLCVAYRSLLVSIQAFDVVRARDFNGVSDILFPSFLTPDS